MNILIVSLVDSSKQRQRLRRKISLDKDSLKATVANYNQSVDESSRVLLDNIEKGDFPWQLTDDARSGSGKNSYCSHHLFFFFCRWHYLNIL